MLKMKKDRTEFIQEGKELDFFRTKEPYHFSMLCPEAFSKLFKYSKQAGIYMFYSNSPLGLFTPAPNSTSGALLN
jgi:hypothetical protein